MPPRKGSTQARGAHRREQILDVAFELFAKHGIRNTTTAALAEGCGITEAGLFHHFASKDDILLAVLARADASVARIGDAIAESDTIVEALHRLHESAQPLSQNPSLARLRAMVTAEGVTDLGATRAYVTRRTAAIRDRFAAAFSVAIETGEIRPDLDPIALATEVVAFMEGIQIEWVLDPDHVDIVAAYRTYADALVERVRAAPA